MSKAKQRKDAEMIFERWEAELINKDRSKQSLEDNFDDLFFELERSVTDIELAREYLERATRAHYPDKTIVEHVYKRAKKFGKSKEEFHEGWKKIIRAAAISIFYSRFKIDGDKKKEESPKGMSKEEYRRYRRYADSFPVLDTSNLPD